MNVVSRRTNTEQLIQRYQSVCTELCPYILSGIPPMMWNAIVRILFSSKKFQRNIKLDIEYILGSYNFLEWQRWH